MSLERLMKKICSCIISFILMLSMLAIISLHILDVTVLDQSYMLSLVARLNLTNVVYDSSMEIFEMYIEQSGFNKDVLKDVLTKDNITKDLNGVIRYIYEDVEYSIDSTKLKSNLKTNINNYIKDNNIIMTAELKANVDMFVEDIGEKYEHNIISSNLVKEGASIFSKVKDIAERFKNKLYIIPAFLILVLIGINYKNVFKSVTYTGIAVMPLSIILYAPVFITNRYMDIKNINILNDVVSIIIQKAAKEVVDKFSIFACITFISGIALIILGNLFRKYRGLRNANCKRGRNKWEKLV